MSFPYDILGKFLPNNVSNVVRELSKSRQKQLIDQTPEPLQTIIIILQQGLPPEEEEEVTDTGYQPPPGTLELRRPMSPLPKNGFQI